MLTWKSEVVESNIVEAEVLVETLPISSSKAFNISKCLFI